MSNEKYGERAQILDKLEAYVGIDHAEESMRRATIEFIRGNENCFERSLLIGHVNGSAWIVDSSFQYVLLTHHQKLDKWLQLGGHSDGNSDTLDVASREAWEESGLESVKPLTGDIFDIDVHTIPERGSEPEHEHYDIRFIFTADMKEELKVSPESKDLRWVRLEEIDKLNTSDSLKRMAEKTRRLLRHI